jgi:methionyl aminopeptidase
MQVKLLCILICALAALILVACRRSNLSSVTVPDAVKTGDAYTVLEFAFRQFESLLVEGGTPRDLEAAASRILDAAGAHGYFKGYHGYPSLLCVSFNEETVHTPPSKRAFKLGDIVKVEFGVEKDGEHAFLGWTYPIGIVGDAKLRLMAGAKAALDAGVQEVRAGNRVGAVSQAIQNALNSNHLVPSRDYVGYQIGKQAHMSPPIPCFHEGDEVKGPEMQQGQKLAILVIAHPESSELKVLGDGWTVVARDGKPSALFSTTVQVLPEGGRRLTNNRPL